MQRHLILIYAIAIVVGVIAARVEYLNAAAGRYLPRTISTDAGKWRTTFLNEERWRRFYGPLDESGEPAARALTAAEQQQMQSDSARISANDRLRDWVGSAGLLQYLLLPALVFITLAAIAARPTRQGVAMLAPVAAVIVFAFASLWYREYFSSLGW